MKCGKEISLLLVLAVFCGAGKHHNSIKDILIPPNLKNTILLVENFEYQPINPPGIDSTNYKNRDFPALEKKANTLREDNEKLKEAFNKYKYGYILAGATKIAASADMGDKTRFRFILKRKPETHYNIDKKGDTAFIYVYFLYFNDRLTGEDFPGIEINARDYFKTMEAIVKKMNKMGANE